MFLHHTRKQDGRRGEELAAAFLHERGFLLVATNWTCRLGEIDLIVRRGTEMRFIEVKTRRTLTYGYPEEAITGKKLVHLRRAIECWLKEHPPEPDHYQADAISILIQNGIPRIYWIEGIL